MGEFMIGRFVEGEVIRRRLCEDDHRYQPVLRRLPESQAGAARKACAGCAYELGYNDARRDAFEAINQLGADE